MDFPLAELPNIQWTGSVVLTQGEKVYINRGEREGVTVGQRRLEHDSVRWRLLDHGEHLVGRGGDPDVEVDAAKASPAQLRQQLR